MLVDIGCNGRVSDGDVYCNTKISKAVKENHLNVPGPKPLPESDVSTPYTVVADDAFPLKPYIQKLYLHIEMIKERQIFNYCLSCACRRVKDTFGILSNRFRVFNTPIGLQPKKVETTFHLVALIQKTYTPMMLYPVNGDRKQLEDCNL
ncbi:PREDICTED: uncharacterized protein LOC109593781 [Amphimedon queenslandica]|uniref:DDE Tnp4 domain-containing protein n=1 Tax=Amphimedon queenslandica TaxID=400682 RepID=A0A1X7VKD3_AMPQE|nr:PREDICTED: uncharacterized protein LOC109593781 [Amphimedon queenslandica]|eukprot:XP_019864444.1 PREDICTED: uncharacterized protein LOC109593781 [Amphimedon queenslandica]